MRNILFLFILLIVPCGLSSANSFIVPKVKTRASKNALKENIGDSLKNALYSCNAISSELGILQKKLADLQRKLLSRVELLIENRKPFKKAKKSELSNTLELISKIEAQLKYQKDNVVKIVAQMENNKCLKVD